MEQNGKQANIGKNFLYNTFYQILSLIIPLVTTPYISRIFGADGVGVYSYVNSAATVFSMIAALGVLSYGQRTIAQSRDNKEETSKLFWEISILCMLSTLACLVLWLVIAALESSFTPHFLVSSFIVLAVAFDITWFYAGLEEFRFIVLRNSAVKLFGVAILFLLVKQKDDLLLYMGLVAATGFLGNVTMWTYLPKFLVKVDVRSLHIFRHLKDTLVYFVPTIAATVYTYVDKVMLRFLTEGTTENGYYEQSTKIIRVAQVVLLSINTVTTSRMSYLFAQGKLDEMKVRMEQTLSFILLLAFPFSFGIIGISENFVPWFFGEGFEPVARLLRMHCLMLIIIGISNCLGTQYLTPSGQRGRSSIGIVLGACANVVLNYILIPKFGAVGAIVASIAAEFVIFCVYLSMSKAFVSLSMIVKHSWKRIIASLCMLAVVLRMVDLPISGAALTMLQICVGALVYFVVLVVTRDSMVYEVVTKIVKRIRCK